jgi:hypothetical protein
VKNGAMVNPSNIVREVTTIIARMIKGDVIIVPSSLPLIRESVVGS